MDAMVLGYPPEDAGKISVTATKEEWVEIIRAVTYMSRNETSEEMVAKLYEVGV